MDQADLERELYEKNSWLFAKLKEQRSLVANQAEAEKAYRIALAGRVLEYRVDGMSVTIIPDLARGDKTVADLRLKRDIAKGISDACRQGIIAIQASMNGLQTLIANRRQEMKLL